MTRGSPPPLTHPTRGPTTRICSRYSPKEEATSDFTVTAGGRLFRYVDSAGSNNALRRLTLRLNTNDTRKSRIRLRTIRTDFSAVPLADNNIQVEIAIGGHTISDTRLWELKGLGTLKPTS